MRKGMELETVRKVVEVKGKKDMQVKIEEEEGAGVDEVDIEEVEEEE